MIRVTGGRICEAELLLFVGQAAMTLCWGQSAINSISTATVLWQFDESGYTDYLMQEKILSLDIEPLSTTESQDYMAIWIGWKQENLIV